MREVPNHLGEIIKKSREKAGITIEALANKLEITFYPEKPTKDSEVENLLRQLSDCDERSLEVIKATAKALIDTAQ